MTFFLLICVTVKFQPQKKAIDWEDYFGIDKKKRSPVPQRTYVSQSRPHSVVGTVHKSPPHAQAPSTTKGPILVPTTAKIEHEHHTTQSAAEREAEKEKQIQEFYKNMASQPAQINRQCKVPIPAV